MFKFVLDTTVPGTIRSVQFLKPTKGQPLLTASQFNKSHFKELKDSFIYPGASTSQSQNC